MTSKPSIYLAGPDIFREDAVKHANWQREICEKYGLIPVHPMDNNLNITQVGRAARKKVCEADISQMLKSDVICANMNPFRGPEPDSGTCFEVGFFSGFNEALVALGLAIPQKPVYGYMDTPSTYRGRAEKWEQENPQDCASAPQWKVSPVEMHINLMMEATMEEHGAFLTNGFEACIRRISLDWQAGKFKLATQAA